MSGKYRPMHDETTDDDVTSGEDGPLSQDTETITAKEKKRKYSEVKFGGKCDLTHNRNKLFTTIFIVITLTFAITTWVLILLFGFVFAPKLRGDESETLVCNLPASSEEIVKPLISRRSYLYKELENELRVLVISDPETEISAAALSVLSGTLNEGDVDGLAHFCEHMLFLGNQKYPKPDYFFDFVSEHGGGANAYTDLGITNYFFQVEPNSFVSAMDIFSSFFINPLFNPDYVQKEINAVNSEYEYDKLVKEWRIFRLLQVVSKANSPFAKFSIGNIETLNISSISTKVSKYYNDFYSSNLMTGVLYGNQNVTELMSIAEANFSSIPNKNFDRKFYSSPYDDLPKLVIAQGITKETDLILTFQLPSFQEHYRMAPSFITHLLSYSGNGSYIGYLEGKNLIFEVDFSVEDIVSTSLLVISLRIPDYLIYDDKWSDIVTHFFFFVDQLRNIPSEDMKVIFDSWLDAQQKHFDYDNQNFGMSSIAGLARQMQIINASQFFLNPPCALEYDYNFINTEVLGRLTPSNLLVLFYSDSFNITGNQGWPNLTLTESYFYLNYQTLKPSDTLLEQWNQNPTMNFTLPENLPIPSDLNLLTGSNSELNPKLTLSEGREIWHLQNTEYSLPYLKLECLLQTDDFTNSTLNAATVQLFLNVLETILPAHLEYYQNFYLFAYSYDYMNGIFFRYLGYSDGTLLTQFMDSTTELVTDVLSLFQNPLFDVGYSKLESDLENFYQALKVSDIAFYYYFPLLFYPNFYRVEDILSSLGSARDNFTSLMTKIHQNSFFVCFTFGNIDDSLTNNLVGKLHTKVGSQLKSHPTLPQVIQLCPGKNYTFWQLNPVKGDINSVLDVVFELGRVCNLRRLGDSCDSFLLKKWVLLKILNSVMSPLFFSQLRTEEQLGYIVYSRVERNHDTAFLHFFIQSSIRDPDYLEQRVNAFLLQFKSNLTIPNLTNTIRSYNDSITEPDSFNSAYDTVWSEINNGQYQFSRISQIRNLLLQISPQEVISFYEDTFFGASAAPRMNIKIFADIPGLVRPSNQTDFIFYETIDSFKSKINLGC